MNVLIIGSGGREHALGWKIKQSPACDEIYFAPGNAGTAKVGRNVTKLNPESVETKDVDNIRWFCKEQKIELVIIGPEDPLAKGLADKLRNGGLKVFGPSKAAAQLEADKAWSKKLMRAASVPTAEAQTFTDADRALHYVETRELPQVVKAAGLAKGKGVIVCDNTEEAIEAVKQIMVEKEFGAAGDVVVIEERLVGQEVSILALVDGQNIYVLEPSQDHKQVGEGDVGPNTGGMGAYTPTPLINDDMMGVIEAEVLVPTVDALRREEIEFKGVLYAGLMLTAGGPKVLEFNCRFGDPECQPLLVRMKGDLLKIILAVCDGTLHRQQIDWDPRVACCVVVCSGGYPGEYEKGLEIHGLDEAAAMEDVTVFHAGTRLSENKALTNGGRVINVVALGKDLTEAKEKANAAAAKIQFKGAFYRTDIGDRVLT